jgi:hypothetical protein
MWVRGDFGGTVVRSAAHARTEAINQGIPYHRPIAHVSSDGKRCHIVQDRIRLWKVGVRNLVWDICCALHRFRVRLTPW